MAVSLASDAFDRARVFLNDVIIDLYTNDVLLPVLKIANDEFSDRLANAGVASQKEISANITLTQGSTQPSLPSDIISPIQLFEKNVNDTDDVFSLMYQKSFEPNKTAGPDLKVWAWREQTLYVPPATQTKIIRLRYLRLITVVSSASTPLEVTGSLNYLACKTAELAAKHIGQNSNKATELNNEAEGYWSLLLGIKVKDNQGIPTRKLPFKGNRSNRRR